MMMTSSSDIGHGVGGDGDGDGRGDTPGVIAGGGGEGV